MGLDGEDMPKIAFAAELGALAGVAAGRGGLDPERVNVAGKRVELSGKTRDPEGMDDVATGDADIYRTASGMCRMPLVFRPGASG
jgi:hypothetical protein